MNMQSNGESEPGSGGSPPDQVAMDLNATRLACRHRRERLLISGAVSCAAVLGLVNVATGVSFVPFRWLVRLLHLLALGAFVYAALGYLRLLAVERMLRVHPWVPCRARSGAVRVGRFQPIKIIQVHSPDWPAEPIRTLPSVGYRTVELLATGDDRILVAGNPDRSFIVSTVDGARPTFARRPLLSALISRSARFPS